jgi:glycerol-1-phosphate dehydrogenase [NAD(P)+]
MQAILTAQRIVIPDALRGIGDAARQHEFGKKLLLVCDETTWNIAGHAAGELLSAAGHEIIPCNLGKYIHATLKLALEVMARAEGCDGLVAAGSGTINDITKYAAMQLGIPYLCVATAPSMNGYTSASASLEIDGLKQSRAAQPPRVVIADMKIIAAAPKRMMRAGLGDTLCRNSVEPDMLMSHMLLGTPYPKEVFERLRSHEAALFAQATQMRESDIKFLTLLMKALIDGGDAMAETGSSGVASQGEHMIAHTAELLYGRELYNVLHGELIAVTTLTCSHLQRKVLLTQPIVKPMPQKKEQFVRLFGSKLGREIAALYEHKMIDAARAEKINAHIQRDWPEMKAELSAVILPPHTVERAFLQANIPTRPSDIGIAEERYLNALTNAHLSRERFTFLDLAHMNGKRMR